MTFKTLFAAIALCTISSAAFASSGVSGSELNLIASGHGKPGQIASTANHEVTYEALAGGAVKRTNRHFGTVAISHPQWQLNHRHDLVN